MPKEPKIYFNIPPYLTGKYKMQEKLYEKYVVILSVSSTFLDKSFIDEMNFL